MMSKHVFTLSDLMQGVPKIDSYMSKAILVMLHTNNQPTYENFVTLLSKMEITYTNGTEKDFNATLDLLTSMRNIDEVDIYDEMILHDFNSFLIESGMTATFENVQLLLLFLNAPFDSLKLKTSQENYSNTMGKMAYTYKQFAT
jgi:hypothetical protein